MCMGSTDGGCHLCHDYSPKAAKRCLCTSSMESLILDPVLTARGIVTSRNRDASCPRVAWGLMGKGDSVRGLWKGESSAKRASSLAGSLTVERKHW